MSSKLLASEWLLQVVALHRYRVAETRNRHLLTAVTQCTGTPVGGRGDLNGTKVA
jgi:hypothetical protein